MSVNGRCYRVLSQALISRSKSRMEESSKAYSLISALDSFNHLVD
jgi:hypothetical protein